MSFSSGNDDTSKPGFVSTIILKFNTLTVGKSEGKSEDQYLIVKEPKSNTTTSNENISSCSKTSHTNGPSSLESSNLSNGVQAKFEVFGDISVKDRIKAFAALSSAVNVASKISSNAGKNIQSRAYAQRLIEKYHTKQQCVDEKSSKEPTMSEEKPVDEKSKKIGTTASPRKTSHVLKEEKIKTNFTKNDLKNIQARFSKQNVDAPPTKQTAAKTNVSVASILQKFNFIDNSNDKIRKSSQVSDSKISTDSPKEQSSGDKKDVVVKISKIDSSDKDPENSSSVASKENLESKPQYSQDSNQDISDIKMNASLRNDVSNMETSMEYNLKDAEENMKSETAVEPDISDLTSNVNEITEVSVNETTESLQLLSTPIKSSEISEQSNLLLEQPNDVMKRLDSLSSVSSTGDLISEFTCQENNVYDPSTDPNYHPLPTSYNYHIDSNGVLYIKLPETKLKSALKRVDSNSQNRKRSVNINSVPTLLMETYGITEYERGDPTIDPLTASAEYEIEKKTESLDKFQLQIHKDERGLGLSIVGIGLGSDTGAEKLGIYIKGLTPGGAAEKTGKLMVHDQLLEVDGISLVGVTQTFAAQTLKSTSKIVNFLVGREKSPTLPM